MANVPLRLRVLIGIALVLIAVVAWRYLFAGGGDGEADDDPAAARIEEHRRKGDVAALAREVADPDVAVARRAVAALGRIGPKSLPQIRQALRDSRPQVRQEAATAFARAGRYDQAAPVAAVARQDKSANVRAAAVSALGRLYAFDEMETLLAAMEDADELVRRRAAAAVKRIIGIGVGFNAADPPEKRRLAVQQMRAVWADPENRMLVREYWPMVIRHREQGKKGK